MKFRIVVVVMVMTMLIRNSFQDNQPQGDVALSLAIEYSTMSDLGLFCFSRLFR